jgi:hypothetical protein
MAISDILARIDQEIGRLQRARVLLSGDVLAAPKKAVGRPKMVVVAVAPKKAAAAPVAAKPAKVAKKKKRNLSPEGRKRIAEAVKKRWAAQKATGGK